MSRNKKRIAVAAVAFSVVAATAWAQVKTNDGQTGQAARAEEMRKQSEAAFAEAKSQAQPAQSQSAATQPPQAQAQPDATKSIQTQPPAVQPPVVQSDQVQPVQSVQPAQTQSAAAKPAQGQQAKVRSAPPQPQVQLPPAPPVPMKASSVRTQVIAEEIAVMNERAASLAAELAELELMAKLAAKRAEIAIANGTVKPADDFIPSVVAIDGVDGKLRATLNMHGGNIVTVRGGESIGVWKVAKIGIDSVTIQRGREVVRLGFGSYAPTPPLTQRSAAGSVSTPAPMPGQ